MLMEIMTTMMAVMINTMNFNVMKYVNIILPVRKEFINQFLIILLS